MSDDKPWGRRLVVCCDGTWQSSVSGKDNVPSNVTKLCRLISRVGVGKDGTKFHQIVYYDGGVGTGSLSAFDVKWQGGTGAGLAENVIEAYNFIVQNYEAGDEIFCFGFSRGAYTARAVAGLVGDIGVIKPTEMQFFPELYRLYMMNKDQLEFRKTEEWRWYVNGKLSEAGKKLKDGGEDPHNIPETDLKKMAEVWEIRPHKHLAPEESRKIKVVGVFDTVGSLGIPDMFGLNMAWDRTKYAFHNVGLSEHVEHAYQALALDERRNAFRPTLWYIPHELVKDPSRPTPELKQVWFPGVHVNCGGGSTDSITEIKGDSENISTATLCWMLQCISPYLTIDRDAFELHIAQYKRWLFRIRYACTYHHMSLGERIWNRVPILPSIYPGSDEFAAPRQDPPHVHTAFDFSWGTGPLDDPYGGFWRFNGTHTRVPGHEKVEKKAVEKELKTLGTTNEYIHPLVYHRKLVRGWDAHSALKDNWNRGHWRGDDDHKRRFWWYKDGEEKISPLPEWAVMPNASDNEYNFERKWYKECEKTRKTLEALAKESTIGPNDFLESLDKEIDFDFDDKPQNLWP